MLNIVAKLIDLAKTARHTKEALLIYCYNSIVSPEPKPMTRSYHALIRTVEPFQ
jgi:hypothetical protein